MIVHHRREFSARSAPDQEVATLTPFQRHKIVHFFNVFDVDRDGFVERADLERWVDEIARARGAGPGSPEHDGLQQLRMFTWAALEKRSVPGRGEVVAEAEWVDLSEALLDTEEGYTMVMDAIGVQTFDVLDADGDGMLGPGEWRAFYRALRLHEEEADRTFPILDLDGDGRISRQETMDRLREFFLSDDRNAPGNLFFGALPPGATTASS